METLDRIDETSTTPKYIQVINSIIADIEAGILQHGQRIPSINETSEMYYLSRDTIEKAYKELQERGIITSVRGKGNYICKNFSVNKIKVLLLFNKLSAYKKTVYYSLLNTLGENAIVDIHIHHYDGKVFQNLLEEHSSKYHYYVIMPHFTDFSKSVLESIKKIPINKLIILDKDICNLDGDYAAIYQDFKYDINNALHSGIDLLYKYERLTLVFPKDMQYPLEIVEGFKMFCKETTFESHIIDGIDEEPISSKTAYIVLEETDLVELIKKGRAQKLIIGQDLGIISYNDTPLKEILANGITVISTDHEKMGETAAYMILNKKKGKIRNPFTLIRRNSL